MPEAEIKKRFFSSIKRGTGEAYILQRQNPEVDFSRQIVLGSLKNYADDPQCEFSKADYLFRLIRKSKQKDRIIRLILARLRFQKSDFYGLNQMCDLAVRFHEAGYAEASEAINKRVLKNDLEDYEACGHEQLTRIDGLAGVLQVARLVGKHLLKTPGDWEDSYLVDQFQKRNRHIDVYSELEKASKEDKNVRAYYDAILENKSVSSNRRRRKGIARFTYELVKQRIDSNFRMIVSKNRADELSEAETERLALEFLNEKEVQRKESYLRFFGNRKFPFSHEPIFEIAKGLNPPGSRLVYFALEALKHFKADLIRDYAVENIKAKRSPGDYVRLLINNYKQGDAGLLAEIIRNAEGDEAVHQIGAEIIDLYELNPTAECREPLELIYDRMNCGIHRSSLLKILIENNVLSDRIYREMEFDSYDDVRKLFRGLRKKE